MLEASGQEEYEEWKDEYEGILEKYSEIIKVDHATSVNGCVEHIGCRFSQITTGSFKIEASGDDISKAVTIVQTAQRESKEKWESRDFLEIEDIRINTKKREKSNMSEISVLLSKRSFNKAKMFLKRLFYIENFNPRQIISILKDSCRIEILKYLEILSKDDVLKNYFRCLGVLLISLKPEKRLMEQVSKEKDKFETINGTRVKGFAQGIYDLYGVIEVIDNFLSAKDIEDMITLENTIESYYKKIARPEPYTKMIYDKIKKISENIKKFRDIENPYYKLYYLSEARILLEDINGIVGGRFVEPFKTMYLVTFDRWRNILDESKEKTKINPKIEIIPEYEPKSKDEMTTIKMTLDNVGLVEVEDIELKIIENKNFKVVDENPKKINIIPQNRKNAVYFRIIVTSKRINVRYILKYSTLGKDFEKKDSFTIFPEATYEEFKKIPNPYVFGRPLKPGKGDVFVGREDIFRFIEQNFERSTKAMIFIIHGQRRTGKTSLLHYLPKNINVHKEFIYIDMQLRQEQAVSDFLFSIADIISKKTQIRTSTKGYKENPYAEFEKFLRKTIEKSENGLVLMFDEFELLDERIKNKSIDIDDRFLEFLRGILHKEDKLALMFTGTFDESKISSKWKILFGVGFRVSLTSLRESEARFLIENPVKDYVLYSDIARDRLIDLSGRNPFYLQGLCRILIDRLNRERRNYARIEDVEEIQSEAIGALVYSYSHFWDNLSLLEKKICKTLATIQLREYDVAVSDIESSMKGEKIDHEEIKNIMEDLFRREILEKYSQDIPKYRFTIELLAHQVHRFGRC